MADITYDRITPRARSGTAGMAVSVDIEQSAGAWVSPPERVAAVSIATHIPEGEEAEYAVECCFDPVSDIGSDGTGGVWFPVQSENTSYTADTVWMVANAATGFRVRCISANSSIHVCFVA